MNTEEYKSEISKFNIIWILYSVCMAVFFYAFRIDFKHIISLSDYLFIVSVTTLIILLPDYIFEFFRRKNKISWYTSIGYLTILSIVLLAILGYFLGRTPFIEYPIIVTAVFMFFYELFKIRTIKQVGIICIGISLVMFVMLQMLNGDYISPLFYEKTILGLIHRDTIFHSSVSSIINSYGFASTGLHGTPVLNYHWGSHLLFAGYINMFNKSGLLFYNLIYPILFLSIFAKSAFIFFETFKFDEKINAHSWIMPLISILIFAFLGTSDYFKGFPFGSQSTIIAIIFIWLHLSIIFEFRKLLSPIPTDFVIFSILLVVALFFLKISSGLVYFLGIAYVYIRLEPKMKTIIFIALASILAFVVLMLIFPSDRVSSPKVILSGIGLYNFISSKLDVFWKSLSDVLVTFIGIIILITVLFKNESLRSWDDFKKVFFARKYVLYESLALMNITAISTALYLVFFTGEISAVVYYLLSTPIFLSIGVIVTPIKKVLSTVDVSKSLISGLVLVFIGLLYISKPTIAPLIQDRYQTRISISSINSEQSVLSKLIDRLEVLRVEKINKKIAIYIPLSESWYFHSQTYRDIASPFIVPSFTGIPMIGGVPEFILNSGRMTYGFYLYQNLSELPLFEQEIAISIAKEFGFDELIIFKKRNDDLSEERVDLKGSSF